MTKPSRFGEGRGKFGQFGKGQFIRELPQDSYATFNDFRGGYHAEGGRELVPPNASSDMIDFLVTQGNRLARIPGTAAVETLFTHIPFQMIQQVSLSNAAELIMFDPPYIGIKTSGATDWNSGPYIASTNVFVYAQYGETLIFSNRAGPVFAKEPGAAPVSTPTIPQARSYFVFAERLYAAGSVIDGTDEPMGMSWSAANAEPRDFDSEGAGSELLLADAATGDEVVAGRIMNLDLCAVICKSSIWIGRRTGNTFEPAAFEPRVIGNGGLTDRLVCSTPMGVMYLSDTGVRVFDGNQSTLISAQINNDLLPLDQTNLAQWRMFYDFPKNRTLLMTPSGTWIFDLEYQRWFKSSRVASDAAYFGTQIGGTTWAQLQTLGQAWSALATTPWLDLSSRPFGDSSLHFLKYFGNLDSELAVEDPTSTDQFGTPMIPHYTFRHEDGKQLNSLVSVRAILVEYKGAATAFRFFLPDIDGNLVSAIVQDVPASANLRDAYIPLIWTGRGAGLKMQVDSGIPEITKVQLILDERSPKIDDTPFVPREYRTDFDI
jgi:hypothetical protein